MNTIARTDDDAPREMPLLARRLLWIGWPAFLVASAMELLVFALVDPDALHGADGEPLGWSRTAIYSASFFTFWLLAAASSALTTLLSASPFEQNRCTLAPTARPDGCPKQVKI